MHWEGKIYYFQHTADPPFPCYGPFCPLVGSIIVFFKENLVGEIDVAKDDLFSGLSLLCLFCRLNIIEG